MDVQCYLRVCRHFLRVTYHMHMDSALAMQLSNKKWKEWETTWEVTSRSLVRVIGVWIYNHNDYTIFIQSPTLDFISKGRLPAVKEFQPSFSTRAFDFEKCWNVRRHLRVGTSFTTHSPFEWAFANSREDSTTAVDRCVGSECFSMWVDSSLSQLM